jgi:hypothetical protein
VVATEQPFSVADITVSSWSFAIRIGLATILALFVSFKGARRPLRRHPKLSLAFSKPRFMWRNYSRTLNNPRALEDGPAEM